MKLEMKMVLLFTPLSKPPINNTNVWIIYFSLANLWGIQYDGTIFSQRRVDLPLRYCRAWLLNNLILTNRADAQLWAGRRVLRVRGLILGAPHSPPLASCEVLDKVPYP